MAAVSSIDFGYTPILVDHVAQQLHDRYCFMHRPQRGFTDPVPHGECLALDDHAWIREAGFLIASMLPKMGELFTVIRADERRRVSDRITAELVCCDLYDRMNNSTPQQFGMFKLEWAALDGPALANLLGLSYHAICHWGGYAAAIALEDPREVGDGPATTS